MASSKRPIVSHTSAIFLRFVAAAVSSEKAVVFFETAGDQKRAGVLRNSKQAVT